jgi:hypothetical protein
MTSLLVTAELIAILTTLAFIILFRKLIHFERVKTEPSYRLQEISICKYRPIQTLFDDRDYAFLRSQAGYTRNLERRLRLQRRRIFRLYLRDMKRDFSNLHWGLKLLMAEEGHDRPDMARMLLKQRAMFLFGTISAQIGVFLNVFGIGRVDVGPMVRALATLHTQLQADSVPATH